MRIQYLGRPNGSQSRDMTKGKAYEARISLSGSRYIIMEDDVGAEHHIAIGHCKLLLDDRPLTAQPVFDSQYANDPHAWEDDDDYTPPDPADYLAPGIQVIARDVVPEPEGPKSTESLRKYRYTPDIF